MLTSQALKILNNRPVWHQSHCLFGHAVLSGITVDLDTILSPTFSTEGFVEWP